MIAASMLEYMFTTVTCCEEIATKLFWRLPSASLPSKFQDLALRFPGPTRTFKILEILQTIPRLSRCVNPVW